MISFKAKLPGTEILARLYVPNFFPQLPAARAEFQVPNILPSPKEP
jgi:hypothetical protein